MQVPAPGLRQSMAGLHLWAGLLTGWLLYAIFITGGISFFRDELTQWMRPEIPARPVVLAQATTAQHALNTMMREVPSADRWQIDLPGPRSNVVDASWEPASTAVGAGRTRMLINPSDGAPLHPRATNGGEFFYYLHFSLHYLPGTLGRWIVGLCAMMALVAMVSGIIVHRRIFSDFFTFRPGKGQRSWLDAHNATSVLGLPFHLMIVYTGLVTLMLTYMPWGALSAFGPQQARPAMAAAMQPRFDVPLRSGIATPLADIGLLLAQADTRWSGGKVGRIIVTYPGDASARIAIVRTDNDRLSVAPAWLLFDGASGALLATHERASPAVTVWGATYALHLGRFADPWLRWMYFACALLGAAMIATGMFLWTAKRRHRGSPGCRRMEQANIACVIGLLLAIPGFFLANRLLPLDMAQRAQWEAHGFFLCWLVAAAFAFCRPVTSSRRMLSCGAAVLWFALPLADTGVGQRAPLSGWPSGDTLFLAIDLAFVCAGLVCCRLMRTKKQ